MYLKNLQRVLAPVLLRHNDIPSHQMLLDPPLVISLYDFQRMPTEGHCRVNSVSCQSKLFNNLIRLLFSFDTFIKLHFTTLY